MVRAYARRITGERAIPDKYFRYPILSADRRGMEPIEQHRQLLECALKRDAKKAATVLTAHVNNCVEYALRGAPLL